MKANRDLIRKEIIDLTENGNIDLETWDNTPMNTYERNYCMEFLTTEALLKCCNDYGKNVTRHYDSTYEMTIVHKLFPILCARLKETL